MSYIVKNSTQGAIVARLTDAGRKKLSEGKLNIGRSKKKVKKRKS